VRFVIETILNYAFNRSLPGNLKPVVVQRLAEWMHPIGLTYRLDLILEELKEKKFLEKKEDGYYMTKKGKQFVKYYRQLESIKM